MAHFAKLDENNVVTDLIVVHNNELLNTNGIEEEQLGIDFCVEHYGGTWVQSSYNANFRKNHAEIGGVYDAVLDAFIPIKMFKAWVLNTETCRWEPPFAAPDDGQKYYWNEDVDNWELMP